MAKTVNVSLTERSIQSLIDKLNDYSSSLDQRNQVLLADMADEGEGYAKLVFDGSSYHFETGATRASIHAEVEGDSAYVKASEHAAPVEFGFGVIGSEHPHPSGEGHYTTQGAPWKFRYMGKTYKTYGRESRPFLWPTVQYWREIAKGRYKEWFEWQ